MKNYSVEYTAQAEKELSKLDEQTSAIIYKWIEKNLEGCENPRQYGKALHGNLRGKWRYRVGDYRIISEIQDEKIVILIVDVAHRNKVYK